MFDAVLAAGGLPWLLPITTTDDERSALLDRCQGLILSGGADMSPARYGGPAEFPGQTVLYPDREEHDLALIRLAWDRPNLPILAICLGLQEINVVRGGTLIAHLPDAVPGSELHQGWGGINPDHIVRVAPDSQLAAILGQNEVAANSSHHQGAGRIAPGLKAAAWTADGVIEALEAVERPDTIAVQWHPERIWTTEPHHRLFRFLIR